jgi:hypothetical protein
MLPTFGQTATNRGGAPGDVTHPCSPASSMDHGGGVAHIDEAALGIPRRGPRSSINYQGDPRKYCSRNLVPGFFHLFLLLLLLLPSVTHVPAIISSKRSIVASNFQNSARPVHRDAVSGLSFFRTTVCRQGKARQKNGNAPLADARGSSRQAASRSGDAIDEASCEIRTQRTTAGYGADQRGRLCSREKNSTIFLETKYSTK